MAREPEGLDLAIVGQDPRFGGGFRSMATACWGAAVAIGRRPHLYFLSRGQAIRLIRPSFSRLRPSLELFHHPFEASAFPSTFPELDALNQIVGGVRLARRVRRARTVWVVATTAPYGFSAVLARKPFGIWLATGLESEWAARRGGLSASRRLALRVNAPVLRALERLVVQRASAVYALSPAARASVAEGGGVPLERVRILPFPVDLELFHPVPDEAWQASLDRPVLVFAGRANDPRKNFELLAQAFRDVRKVHPEARLRVIGEPPGSSGDAAAAGVELLGPMDNRAVAEPLRQSSIFVLPSFQEGFGIVVAEALACGLPVVATPSGGPQELIQASGGGVVLAGFAREELAGTLLELLANRERLSEMRRRGREYVLREHDPVRFRELLEAALRELDRAA